MRNIKVSVLMPAYNSEIFISKSIESIILQNYVNYELIIVDDGSNDSTKEIIKKYCRKRSNIRLISKSNSGLTDTLNFGLKYCSGEWIARLDSDDLSAFDRLQKQVMHAQLSNKIGLIGSNAIFIDKFDRNLYYFSYPIKDIELRNNLLNCSKFFPHSSAFFNRELVESLGGYRNRAGIAEDWDLWLRIASKGEIKNINKPLVKIRIHDDQISKRNSVSQAYDTRVNVISSMINSKKSYDPIEVFTDNEFIYFRNYIIHNLEKLGLEEYIKFTSLFKNPILKKFTLPLIFLKFIIKPYYLFSFIKLKFCSKLVQSHIADSYVKMKGSSNF